MVYMNGEVSIKIIMYFVHKIFPKNNFYHIIFSKIIIIILHGIKVIDLEYDLKYRAIRRYPQKYCRFNFSITKDKI